MNSSSPARAIARSTPDEGAECMLKVARLLEPYVKSNARISRNVRGGAYQSKFLRDLCHSKELTETVSKICGTDLLPHTIPHQLGHLNYNPKEVGENVDKWHVDTLRIDFMKLQSLEKLANHLILKKSWLQHFQAQVMQCYNRETWLFTSCETYIFAHNFSKVRIMKKFLIPAMAVLTLAACNNEPEKPAATTTETPTVTAPTEPTAEEVAKALKEAEEKAAAELAAKKAQAEEEARIKLEAEAKVAAELEAEKKKAEEAAAKAAEEAAAAAKTAEEEAAKAAETAAKTAEEEAAKAAEAAEAELAEKKRIAEEEARIKLEAEEKVRAELEAEKAALAELEAQLAAEKAAAEELQNATTGVTEESKSEALKKVEEVENAIKGVTDTIKALGRLGPVRILPTSGVASRLDF
ncbi:hypothetical protein GQR58_005310 [Nymphon striatum]|nr:hypothetical protein GQR58_005310 [Nymphon striatum]